MFIVTLVLNELISWMRAQSGTSSLRAIFYMDEIFGYFPPAASPPSKPPMLTLLKQARAFGLGCVLATQNPVDLDYKGLSNAGTWFIGRLQTERDKMRVIDGLESALSGSGSYDRAALDKMMSGLTQRVFLMRNVHDDAPVLFQSRVGAVVSARAADGAGDFAADGGRGRRRAQWCWGGGSRTASGGGRRRPTRFCRRGIFRGVGDSGGASGRRPALARGRRVATSATRSPSAQPSAPATSRPPVGAAEYFLPATKGTGPIT